MDNFIKWKLAWRHCNCRALPELPPPKAFKPKYVLPELTSYSDVFPSWFWALAPANYNSPAKSLVDADKLRNCAVKYGYQDLATLSKVCEDLEFGADIGCVGEFRRPSRATNAPSAYENGKQVTDAVCDWLAKGFAYGPVPMSQVPKTAKFSGIMTRPKPNGSVRIILNLSAPVGQAVNEGIDNSQFPTSMSSTTKWLRVLHRAGRNAKICKVDWSDAYKHVAVRAKDTDLQWFQWGGYAFKELCLIFGGVSSAGIFDRLAKIVLFIVVQKSGFRHDMVCQHLDDCCAAAPFNSNALELYDAVFSEVAIELGVKLAPRDDPEKSFSPAQSGIILGVHYDTTSWTWSLPEEKLIRLLHLLRSFLSVDSCQQHLIWTAVGKLQHIKALVPSGKFNIDHLIRANSVSLERTCMIPLSVGFKRQTWFWFSMLRLCSGVGPIPDPDQGLPPWAVDVYTDSAGGAWEGMKGAGACTPTWWAFVPWSIKINRGCIGPSNRQLGRMMSALELVGPLLVISAGYSWCRNTPVKIWVDNAGSVFIWKKGYSSSCLLSSTLVKAIATVAAGLSCHVELEKITRCSTPLADMADALSKCAFSRFWDIAASADYAALPLEPAWIPVPITAWLQDPVPDDFLGDKILRELSKRTLVLGLNC